MRRFMVLYSLLIALSGCSSENLFPAGTVHTLGNEDQPNIPIEYPFSVKRNSTLSQELSAFGFSGKDINEIVSAAKPYFDLTRIMPGTHYRILYSDSPSSNFGGVEFSLSSTKTLTIWKDNQQLYQAEMHQKKVTTQLAYFSGSVKSSLWASAEAAKMDKTLIAGLTEVFAWQLDFTREVRENDSWSIVVEQQFVEDKPVGWGKILAADYVNESRKFEAIYFEKEGEFSGYFSPDGSSMEKMFLRSPIEFARITSGFSLKRFHPILNKVRAHLGVDYAAPIGTPIRSVGDGRIAEAKFTNGGGNTLVISHNSIYKTRYLHLKGFARGLRSGSFVKQGQIVGYVGMTGLSTGPHLHFEFYQNGKYRDPLKVDLPSAEAIPKKYLTEFQALAQKQLALLPSNKKIAKRETASATYTE